MRILLLACVLTVLIETALFVLFGYRGKDDVIIVACANVITNLTLNLVIALVFSGHAGLWLLVLEAAVVASEYAIYAKAFGASKRLLLQTFAANACSFAAGVILSLLGLFS